MHVFSDLMPYLCTFDGCQHKLRSFQSRSSWADHEFEEHRLNRYWACPECSRKSYSILDWEHHLDDVHNLKFFDSDLVAARKNACHISPKRAEEEQCPLCQVILGKPRRAFVKHVSRHMEDIALMALPSNAARNVDLRNARDAREYRWPLTQYDPVAPETPHLGNLNRERRHLTPEGREHARVLRKVQACKECRRRKIKVSVLPGSDFSTVTNACLV